MASDVFNESTRARLLLSLGINASGLEKHEDAVGLDQVFRSVSREQQRVPEGVVMVFVYVTKWVSLCVGPRLEMYNMALETRWLG